MDAILSFVNSKLSTPRVQLPADEAMQRYSEIITTTESVSWFPLPLFLILSARVGVRRLLWVSGGEGKLGWD